MARGRRVRSCELRAGDRFYIGSDQTSDVCLADEGVAPTHCAVSVGEDSVVVEDCYSEQGTFVNDRRIRSEKITTEANLRLGEARMAIKIIGASNSSSYESDPAQQGEYDDPSTHELSDVASFDPADQDHAPQIHAGPLESPVVAANVVLAETVLPAAEMPAFAAESMSAETSLEDPVVGEAEVTAPLAAAVSDAGAVALELLQAQEEIKILQARLQQQPESAGTPQADPYQEEMIELLREEVIQLQTALAERDEVDQLSHTPAVPAPSEDEMLSREDAEKLVDRLEQLLAELTGKDEEITRLTGMLQLAEESAQAEKEERAQIDSWLKDIEERFGQREAEWQAERDRMQAMIESTKAERTLAESAMNADSSSARLEAAQNVIKGLRETAESQREHMLALEEKNNQLTRQLQQAEVDSNREERMAIAQERALLAQQRQELEAEMQRQQKTAADETTLKLQVLRQHLNEIHEEERAEKEERKLGSRLSRLWRRLDGA